MIYKIILFTSSFFIWQAPAVISINVGKAHVRQSQIALQPFVLKQETIDAKNGQIGSHIFRVLENNLSSLGRFKLIDQAAFLEQPGEKDLLPYPLSSNGFIWKNWELLNTDYLILGRYSFQKRQNRDSLNMQVEIFIYHIALKRKLLHKQYTASLQTAHRLAHYISNDIVQTITRKKGIFLTKIVGVKLLSRSKKELFIMDWNGDNKKQISFHQSIVVSPFWSHSGKQIAYTAYLYHRKKKTRNPALLLYDFSKNNRKIISNKRGANLGFAFLPHDKGILASLWFKGYRNIVKISLTQAMVQSVTSFVDGSINVEPSLHPNGSTIAFSSDRSGPVMIYSTNLYGKDIRRLTYQGSYNSTPEYSPNGKHIVFSGFQGGRFDIFMMRTDGSELQRLTSAKKIGGGWANHESPSFSPDGENIVFSSNQSGTYQLYIMNIASHRIKQITNDKRGFKSPKWSPFLNY